MTADQVQLGGVTVELGADGSGITGWMLRGVEPGGGELDGLATVTTASSPPPPPVPVHPNGAIAIDHVVVVTPDFDRTATALAGRGMQLRRVTEAGGARQGFSRQGFRRLGPAILELVEAGPARPIRDRVEANQAPGPARFWGLVVIARDLEMLHERLRPHLGEIRPAVQPGRRIAALKASAGLSPRLAFMDPEPPPRAPE